MRLALKMKTRSATRKVEEVFCCEETREKREKKRGEERKQREEEREVLLFFLVLFVFGQSDFFGCIPLKTSSSSLILTRPSLNKNNSLSLFTPKNISLLYSLLHNELL